MSKSGDGADRTIFSTKSLKTFDQNLNNLIYFWDVFQNIVFQFFNWFYSFSWAETVCWNQYKMFLLSWILWKQLKKLLRRWYCITAVKPWWPPTVITSSPWWRGDGDGGGRGCGRGGRGGDGGHGIGNHDVIAHPQWSHHHQGEEERVSDVSAAGGFGAQLWQAFGFDFRLIVAITSTIFILVVITTADWDTAGEITHQHNIVFNCRGVFKCWISQTCGWCTRVFLCPCVGIFFARVCIQH